MKRIILTLALLLPLLAHAAHAQKGYPRTLYVTYDGAQVFDSASYLSSVLGELRLGDSVIVLESRRKFFRIGFAGREGYILGANVAEKKPATGGSKKGERTTRAMEKEKRIADSARGAARPFSDSLSRGEKTLHDHETSRKEARSRTAAPVESESQSQQCRATTKAGKRCSRMTTDPTGYCWQHKK